MSKRTFKTSVFSLSVEEENLATVPFAVLERRVGKRVGKIEIKGTKRLPDGTEMDVLWQVQGNSELGLPTEQDLDILVALGVLTFRGNFSKTVSFTGRELARILNIENVHGKFYQRLKLAMDRFIPLRFRALSASDQQEEVKWLNMFQEASFILDRATGRCTGTVTWTDKLIHSMDNGFFRLLDSSRYMELDGITAKHLYRFLTVAFEKTDLLVIDARKLSSEHLGIVNVPKYFSRLMQTLEPAFEQLMRVQVVGSYHVVSGEEWRIALRRHAAYMPERRALAAGQVATAEELQGWVSGQMEKAGFPAAWVAETVERHPGRNELAELQRAARLVEEMKQEEVYGHVAMAAVRGALEEGIGTRECRDALDWCEIGLEVCRMKRNQGQALRNLPGLLVKIARDAEGRAKLVSEEQVGQWKQRFRQREEAAVAQLREAEERELILEYESFRDRTLGRLFDDMALRAREDLRRQKAAALRNDQRFQRLPVEVRDREIDEMIRQELARAEVPAYEKWLLRRRAAQAVLPFQEATAV